MFSRKSKPKLPERLRADPAKDRLTVSKNGIEGVGKAVDAAYRLTVLKYAFRFVLAVLPIIVPVLIRLMFM